MSYPAAMPPAPARLPVTGLVCPSPPTGELFELASSARSPGDGNFRFVWTLSPGKTGPGEHVHEDETEHFEIVSGTIRIWVSGQPHDYSAGDHLVIPPNIPHRFLNPGTEPVVVNVALSGPRMEDMLAPVAVASAGRSPRISELLRMMVSIHRYKPSTPVRPVEGWFLNAFASLLRLFGVRAFEPVLGWDARA